MNGLIDTNILIYATAKGCPEHKRATGFMEGVLSGRDLYAITWINVGEYISFVTRASLLTPVIKLTQALENMALLLHSPNIQLIQEGEDYWDNFVKVIEKVPSARGNLIHDCRIAACMLENGVQTIYTRDTDFRKLGYLKVIDPLA